MFLMTKILSFNSLYIYIKKKENKKQGLGPSKAGENSADSATTPSVLLGVDMT